MARFEWNDKMFLSTAEAAIEVATERGAELVERDMKRMCPVDEGEMRAAIGKHKSKFKGGGWIVGVFDPDTAGRWEDSLAARAIFNEYGHVGPRRGRTSRGTKLYRSAAYTIAGAKRKTATLGHGVMVSPPNPFMKPALRRNKRRINRIFQEELN